MQSIQYVHDQENIVLTIFVTILTWYNINYFCVYHLYSILSYHDSSLLQFEKPIMYPQTISLYKTSNIPIEQSSIMQQNKIFIDWNKFFGSINQISNDQLSIITE